MTKKENKFIEKYLPLGVVIGVVIGSVISLILGDLLYLAYGSCGGLILGIIIRAIAAESKKK